MNKIRAFGLGIILLQLSSLAVVALSVHTVLTVLSGAISGETFSFNMNSDLSTGDLLFTLNANLRNSGYLDANLSFEFAVLNADEQYIGRNSTSVNIKAGSTTPFSLSLLIPAELTQGIILDQYEGSLEVTFTVRTLGDLVGFTNILNIGGGSIIEV